MNPPRVCRKCRFPLTPCPSCGVLQCKCVSEAVVGVRRHYFGKKQ